MRFNAVVPFRIFNTLSRKLEKVEKPRGAAVSVFACGPSVYQRPHIGNFRTFLNEDVFVRYLEFLGYRVRSGMGITDIEDKALDYAKRAQKRVSDITESNIRIFLQDRKLLRMKCPDHLYRASRYRESAARITRKLLRLGYAYCYNRDIYFRPKAFESFGEIFGLDMAKWPKQTRRFSKDTYTGNRWNRGDFILWRSCGANDDGCWKTRLGWGRPAWNIQDASIVTAEFPDTLAAYWGGIDNIYRHHDYNRAIIEASTGREASRLWLHCRHLLVDGKKMSKSKGNVIYTDDLLAEGFEGREIRFLLINSHYRKQMNFSKKCSFESRDLLIKIRAAVQDLVRSERFDINAEKEMLKAFEEPMNDDMNIGQAIQNIGRLLKARSSRTTGAGFYKGLSKIDSVLQIFF